MVLLRRVAPLALAVWLVTTAPGVVAAAEADSSEIARGDPSTGVVALTFDAGGVAGPSQTVLDVFRERGIRATFFLSGQWVESYPELAAQVARDGHELANHSYFHPDFVTLTDAQITWELTYTDDLVYALAGRHTRPYFRPPFGSRDRRVLDVAAAAGFRSVYWTLDSGDWREGVSARTVRDRVLRLAQPGDIVAQHVASAATAAALPAILDEFERRGWRVGTVSDVLGLAAPAAPESAPIAPVPVTLGTPGESDRASCRPPARV